jgi:hypothetical protein
LGLSEPKLYSAAEGPSVKFRQAVWEKNTKTDEQTLPKSMKHMTCIILSTVGN